MRGRGGVGGNWPDVVLLLLLLLLRIVTEVSAPSALSSVTMLKDGSTLLGGGADGEFREEGGRGG